MSRAAFGLLAVALAVLATPPYAALAADNRPSEIVARALGDALAILHDASLDATERRHRFEEIARARFDTGTTSRLVLARSWKRFSPTQRDAFRREFETYLLRTYGDRIDRYTEGRMEVVSERPEPRGDVTVRTRVVGGPFDGAMVDYRMRAKDGDWRVIDVVVEGISLVANYRDQFKEVLAREGPEGLLAALREKNDHSAPETQAGSGADHPTP